MRARKLRSGAAAAILGFLVADHGSHIRASAFPFPGAHSHTEDASPSKGSGISGTVQGGDVAAAALFGGGFFGSRASNANISLSILSPAASSAPLSATVAEVLQQAVTSATDAVNGAAEHAAEAYTMGIEQARSKTSKWWTSEGPQRAAEAAREITEGAASIASGAASEAQRQLYALGSLLEDKLPGAADTAYSTAKSASSAAGVAAKELSAAAKDAESAFLAWAGHIKEELEGGSSEAVTKTAEQAAAAAEVARKAAVDAAEKATVAAREARRTLVVLGNRVHSESEGAAQSALKAARETVDKAEKAVATVEHAADTARAALASWGALLGQTLHAGTRHVRGAAEVAAGAAKDLADSLQNVASSASSAAETLESTAYAVSSGAEHGAEKADRVIDVLASNASKPLIGLFMPWVGGQNVQEEPKQAIPGCHCPESATATASSSPQEGEIGGSGEDEGAACNCPSGNNSESILDATQRLLGLGAPVLEEATGTEKASEGAEPAETAGLSSVIQKAGERILSALPILNPKMDLRPTDSAAWLGSSAVLKSETDATLSSDPAQNREVVEALPPVYKEGIPLDCDPLPPYRDCIAQCDSVEAKANDSQEPAPATQGLSSYEYSKKRACYLACVSKWIDTTIPGCMDSNGKVVAGTPPAAQFRSTTTTSTTPLPVTTTVPEALTDAKREPAGTSWGPFLERLQRKEEQHSDEPKENTQSSGLSWFFTESETTTTTTTTVPPNKGLLDSLFNKSQETQQSDEQKAAIPSWLSGSAWGDWKRALTSKVMGKVATDDATTNADSTQAEEENHRDLGESEATNSNAIILGTAAAVLLLALIFVIVVLRRWEAHHRERTRVAERQQVPPSQRGDMQQPLMQQQA
ncbi:uncharacterized protein LOC34622550 [Cyclospora cayetanensis]|uniref:Uncharacterized protein LOC34622550 n=1 Tax=Cyclospora cayetanensis TaxID=88456 RepID=A0A6P6RYN9_9EIME|nr:uncharacterized protein LOC34622550 [Cyclospora cayetanensis]